MGPDDSFQGLLLRCRGRTGLTQRELADRMGVSMRTIENWEGGVNHPNSQSLQTLLAALLEAGGLSAGREVDEAEAFWVAALRESPRLHTPFDRAWLADLLVTRLAAERGPPEPTSAPAARAPTVVDRRQDWGEAPDVLGFLGRTAELARMKSWVLDDSSRLVAVLGMGGIGKTMLAARLAQEVAPFFERAYWRSVRNAPSLSEWLGGAISFLSDQQMAAPEGEAARFALLVQLLRQRRCLVALDNLETLLEPAKDEPRYRDGYAGYGSLLQVLGESGHQSCLLLTSREAPPEVALLGGSHAVRALELGGLGVTEAQALLSDKQLSADEAGWAQLVVKYSGNGLALKLAGETIYQVFGGDIGSFLDLEQAGAGTMFGGIRRLLETQVEQRLSIAEQELLRWLAIEREPVTVAELIAGLGRSVGRAAALEALEALRRRSLVERSERGATFTLQSMVLEYVTDRLVEQVADEVERGQPELLQRYALVKAYARDYVRRSQERLIAQPLLDQLVRATGAAAAAERSLLNLLEPWRGVERTRQGYGPGNVVNLLRVLRGDLNGLDFSHLNIRQVYLQEVEARDARLVGAQLSEAVLAVALDPPTRVVLSADSSYLVAGTTSGAVCVWSGVEGRLLLSIPAHVGPAYGIALSEDATLVASGSQDQSEAVKVWAVPSGRLVASMKGGGGAWAVALSADNRLLASGHLDNTVRLWDVHSGRLVRTLHGHSGTVCGVALSRDGTVVVSGSDDSTVNVWEAVSGRLLRTLKGHTGAVRDIALSADAQVVASGSLDGTVNLWDTLSGKLLMSFLGNNAAVYGVALTHDRRLLASGSVDGLVNVWDANSGWLLATLRGHSAGVWSVALSRDGDLVVSGSQDGTIKLWETESRRLRFIVQGHTTQLFGVALSQDGRRLVGGSQDGTIKMWDAEGGHLRRTVQRHTSKVRGVALSRDGTLLASASQDQTVKLWDVESGRLLKTLAGHRGAVNDVALSGDARLAASGSYDGTVKLWDVQSGRLLATLPHQSTVVWKVALSSDGKLIATGAQDGLARVWDGQTSQVLRRFRGAASPVWSVALTEDCELIASGHEDGSLECWETGQQRILATMVGHSGLIWGLALSADGQLLISGSLDQTVRLWDTRSGHLRMTLTGHTGPVWGVALSADGRLAASASEDGTIRLWATSTGTCLRILRAERRYERMDITGLTGVTEAQRTALVALGAVERPHTALGATPD